MKTFTLFLTLGFIWLATYSYQYAHADKSPGYEPSEIEELNAQVAALTLNPPSLKQRQAQALSDVYNVSADEAAKPVRIFGE